MAFAAVVFLLVGALCVPHHAGAARSPVLIIPGDGGSQLEAMASNKPSVPHFYCEKTFSWSQLWLSVSSLLPGVIDCWADNIKLLFDGSTGTYSNQTGVQASRYLK